MSKKTSDPAIDIAPILGDTKVLCPPSPHAVPVAANISMKLPTFWSDAAEVWFAQANAQFAIRNLTVSKTKFFHAVAVFIDLSTSNVDFSTPPALQADCPLSVYVI